MKRASSTRSKAKQGTTALPALSPGKPLEADGNVRSRWMTVVTQNPGYDHLGTGATKMLSRRTGPTGVDSVEPARRREASGKQVPLSPLPAASMVCFVRNLPVDPREVAWAAGFFDAEGSFQGNRRSVGQARIRASLPQTGDGQVPQALLRFQVAVGLGTIGGPYKNRQHVWYTDSSTATLTVAALMSAWLGDRKHDQLGTAIQRLSLEAQLNPRSRRIGGRSVARRARRDQFIHLLDVCRHLRVDSAFRTRPLEVAWAAGLFDGDGSTSTKRKTRKDGTAFYTVCAGLAQSGPQGVPEVLSHFLRVVGFGRIYGPYRWRNTSVPGYEWQIASYRELVALEALLGPYLSVPKREQARAALSTFANTGHRRNKALSLA